MENVTQSMARFQWAILGTPHFQRNRCVCLRFQPQQSMGLVRLEGKIQRHSTAISLSLLPVGTHHCDHLSLHVIASIKHEARNGWRKKKTQTHT